MLRNGACPCGQLIVKRLRKRPQHAHTDRMPRPRTAKPAARRRLQPEPSDFAEAAETFALLATPTRVQLLWLLTQGEHDVTSLAGTVGATVPAVSQHLAKLRLADLVAARPDGRRQIYRVDDPHISNLVDQAVEHHSELRRTVTTS